MVLGVVCSRVPSISILQQHSRIMKIGAEETLGNEVAGKKMLFVIQAMEEASRGKHNAIGMPEIVIFGGADSEPWILAGKNGRHITVHSLNESGVNLRAYLRYQQ